MGFSFFLLHPPADPHRCYHRPSTHPSFLLSQTEFSVQRPSNDPSFMMCFLVIMATFLPSLYDLSSIPQLLLST